MPLLLLANDAPPSNTLMRDFFYAFVALSVVGLMMLMIGLLRLKRDKVAIRKAKTRNQMIPKVTFGDSNFSQSQRDKIWTRSQGVRVSAHEEYAIRDFLAGMKARDAKTIGFALRFGGTLLLCLSVFLAIGTGYAAFSSSDDGAGWAIIGFVILFIGVQGFRVYRGRNQP